MASAVATEAAVGAGAAALGLFGYNRGNFQYDASFRFERFNMGREMALAQAEQYRGDLRALSGLVQKKNTMYSIMASLCMALCVALYCAGRLGLHGPSPPAWIMGLWYTNNAAAFSFMALCIWLSVHASFRAGAASVHLLTRKTRLPVPSLAQLDEARKFGSEFEQQPWGEILRVPYLQGSGAPPTDAAAAAAGGAAVRSRSAPAGRARRGGCSSWVREEFHADRAGALTGGRPDAPSSAVPEHFQLYAAVQKEWFEYDVYARVCVLYGYLSFVHALGYYGLGHINIELRAFWVAYATGFVLMVLLALILRFDIVPNNGRKELLPKCQYLGPVAWLCAAIGMSLDFRVQFSYTAVAVCWALIFAAYLLQLVYTLRLLELVLPDDWRSAMRPEERIGFAWWPESWRIPSTFQHVLYQVAPPQSLQPGQHDIVREVKEGAYSNPDEAGAPTAGAASTMPVKEGKQASLEVSPDSPFGQTQHIQPWKLVTSIVVALTVGWCFLIVGCIVDVVLGEQALVTAPHWSRPPMTRLSLEPHELGTPLGFPWPAGAKPWLPENMAWHEEKRHAEHDTLGARRLSARGAGAGAAGVSSSLDALLSALTRGLKTGAAASPEPVAWPGFFEPQLLACGPGAGGGSLVAALTPRGFGAAARLGGGAAPEAEAFKLAGIAHLPPLLGASWAPADGGDSLLLVTQLGDVVACPGPRPGAGGTWRCGAPAAGLPRALPAADGRRLAAAAAAWLPGPGGAGGAPQLHAALVHEAAPDLVALYAHAGGEGAEAWTPLGEVPLGRAGGRAALSFTRAGELVVATEAGTVVRQLASGAVLASGPAAPGDWRFSCVLEHGSGRRAAHLHLRTVGGPLVRRPELTTADLSGNGPSALAKGKSQAAFFE